MTTDEFDTIRVHFTMGGYEVQLWPPSWALLIVVGVVAVAILAVAVLATRLSLRKRD